MEVAKQDGTYVDARRAKLTFKEFSEEWRKRQLHRKASATKFETDLRLHVYPVIGHRPLASIRRSECEVLVKGLTDTLAPVTARNICSTVASVFKAAVADRKAPFNPMETVKRPVVDDKEVTVLSPATVVGLIDTIDDRYRALIILGVGTGMRISEALG